MCAGFGHLGDDVGGVQQGLCLSPFEPARRFADMDSAAVEDANASTDVSPLPEFLLRGAQNFIHIVLLTLPGDFHRRACSMTKADNFNGGNDAHRSAENGHPMAATFALQEAIEF